MARSSSRGSGRNSPRPLWLVVLVAALGWAYNSFFKPEEPSRSTRSGDRAQPRATSRARSERTPPRSTVTAQGGVPFRDRVIKVSDGDTVRLERQGSVRLIGVDCPEKAQPGGKDATEFTASALLNKEVEVELCAKQPTDRYGRGLAMISLVSGGRRILFNAELVRQGYARVYSLRPCTVDEDEWNGYYAEAQRNNRGLFRSIGEVPDAASYRRKKRDRTTLLFDSAAPIDACS
jgi:micrococcal nuclease